MIEVKDLQINISAKYLSELTEKVCGEIIITVSEGEETIITEKYPIEILPFDQWAGVAILPEILAAFAPNYPSNNISKPTATHDLTELVSLGIFEIDGKGRTLRYLESAHNRLMLYNKIERAIPKRPMMHVSPPLTIRMFAKYSI